MCKSGSYAKFKLTENPRCTLVSWDPFVFFLRFLYPREPVVCSMVHCKILLMLSCLYGLSMRTMAKAHQWVKTCWNHTSYNCTGYVSSEMFGYKCKRAVACVWHHSPVLPAHTYMMGNPSYHPKATSTRNQGLLVNHHCSVGRNEPLFLLRVDLGGS